MEILNEPCATFYRMSRFDELLVFSVGAVTSSKNFDKKCERDEFYSLS
jgi:hypothetical protein